MSSKTLLIATPCYNEAASLPNYFSKMVAVRSQLAAMGWTVSVLLIDDGSSDKTQELVTDYASFQPGTKVVRHPRNLGYGAAIKTALCLAQSQWLVFVDSDSNYDQQLIINLVKKLEDVGFEADLINVSILAPGGAAGYSWYRLWLSSLASLLYRLLLPRLTRNVYTLTCGFRLYNTSISAEVMPIADDFVATAEIMLRALRNNERVIEFPAQNSKREHGVSKMRMLSVVLGHVRLAVRVLFGVLGKPITIESHLKRIQREPHA